MLFFKKRKVKYPENAKYKENDYVNFRYRSELLFGYIYDAKLDENNNVEYTIQIAGQCPSFIHNYKEDDIIGIKTK